VKQKNATRGDHFFEVQPIKYTCESTLSLPKGTWRSNEASYLWFRCQARL